MHHISAAPPPGSYPPLLVAWRSAAIIFVLTAIALADRMAIAMLIGPIKKEFGLGDFQASLLIGLAFTLFYVLFLLPIGAAADRYSRAKVLGVCLFIWTVATIACGFTVGFISLFLARMLMGAGEAAIGPCSLGIIGASFPPTSLAKPIALQGIGFQIGPAVGVAAAGAILAAGADGAFVGLPFIGDMAPWRIAFILIGLPGFLALLLIPLLHDPAQNRSAAASDAGQSTGEGTEPKGTSSLLSFVQSNAVVMALMLVGSGFSAMGLGTLTGWVPEYLQRMLGVAPAEAGAVLGATMLVAAVIGQGGYSAIVDWCASRGMADAPLRIGLVPVALSVPLAWLAFGATDRASFYPLLFAFAFVVAPFNAINNVVAQQLAPPELRSRVSALFIFVISIVGFAGGPALIGWLSQYVLGESNLGRAMQLVTTAAMLVALLCYFLARKPLLDRLQATR